MNQPEFWGCGTTSNDGTYARLWTNIPGMEYQPNLTRDRCSELCAAAGGGGNLRWCAYFHVPPSPGQQDFGYCFLYTNISCERSGGVPIAHGIPGADQVASGYCP